MSGSEQEMSASKQYEYRVAGIAADGSYRLTDWKSEDGAIEDYHKAWDDWEMVGFERRVVGVEHTLQRRPKPLDGEWLDVTDDMMHPASEEVTA
jgi:hypothetical protein